MSKLLKNWIFTLCTSVVLLTFGILMFFVGSTLMRYFTATALIIYIILVLADNFIHYHGIMRLIAFIELLTVTLLTAGMLFDVLDFLPVSGVNVTVGFLIWMRSAVEIIHGFLIRSMQSADPTIKNAGKNENTESGTQKRKTKNLMSFSLIRLIAYLLCLSFGVMFMTTPLISEKTVQVIIGIIAVIFAVIFGCVTYRNRRAFQATKGIYSKKRGTDTALTETSSAAVEAPTADVKETEPQKTEPAEEKNSETPEDAPTK